IAAGTELPSNLQGITVLVVEDYPTNREIVQHHLISAGCRVDLSSNGLNALKKVQEKRYDMILMDVHMPRMDGMEATSRIRSLDEYSDVPILGMTANVLSSNKEACRRSGMNDVMNKPLRRKELIRAVSFWCSQDENLCKPEVLPRTDQKSEQSPLPLDYQAFLKEMDGDRVVVRDIILGFLDSLEEQRGKIEEAINSRDVSLIHREAHSIKGGALNLGASDLAAAALALEKAASGSYSDIIPHLFGKLKGSIEEVLSCRDRFASIV
ncbi:MAG: response regulator, partial [Spirochaetales bacterium]|nr:response regulator [Spirochaetales bacterium]